MIAAFFVGQGAQHIGMGKDFYESFASVRQRFEEASDILKLNLKKLCFDGSESDLTLTENAQPALLTVSVSIYETYVREKNFKPDVVAGHSLGEYSALVAAGAFSFATAVRLVRERGLAMQRAVAPGEGTMAAVLGLTDEQVVALCKLAESQAAQAPIIVEAANFNSPGQVVIAGTTDGITAACEIAKTNPDFKGAKTVLLSVSAPFHSSLMKPAREHMERLFLDLSPNEKPSRLNCAYVPNRTAQLTAEPGVVLQLLSEQIDHTVLWRQSVEALNSRDCMTAFEFGPGKVLQGLCRRINKSMTVTSINHTESLKNKESQRT